MAPPSGPALPHAAQVATAVITSRAKTSPSGPAAIFPSRWVISASSRRAEALGTDVRRVVPKRHELGRRRLHERGGTADVGTRARVRRIRDVGQDRAVDAARIA